MKGIVFFVLIVVAVAWATEQVVLETDGDSYVKYYFDNGDETVYYADDNFGDEDRLRVLNCETQVDYTDEIAYMHFDFSGLGEYDSVDLVEAELVFSVFQVGPGEQRAYAVKSAWEEMTITYNNQPGAGALLGSFYMDLGDNYVDLDTGPIAPWVDAPETAYGILILDYVPTEEDLPGKIRTRETDSPPELRLTFTGEAVEGASEEGDKGGVLSSLSERETVGLGV